MERRIIHTADGSHSFLLPAQGVTYHSRYGALAESRHIYIEAGLYCLLQQAVATPPLRVFEMGFGTGLNALLTYREALRLKLPVSYLAIDAFPLFPAEASALNYATILGNDQLNPVLQTMHSFAEGKLQLHPLFSLERSAIALEAWEANTEVAHLVYFDAFAPDFQPELWTEAVFQSMYKLLYPGGILVTYCSKGSVRRAMQAAGLRVEKLPGPKGKREIIRARKPVS